MPGPGLVLVLLSSHNRDQQDVLSHLMSWYPSCGTLLPAFQPSIPSRCVQCCAVPGVDALVLVVLVLFHVADFGLCFVQLDAVLMFMEHLGHVKHLRVPAASCSALATFAAADVSAAQREAYYSNVLHTITNADDSSHRMAACTAWLTCCMRHPSECLSHAVHAMGVMTDGTKGPDREVTCMCGDCGLHCCAMNGSGDEAVCACVSVFAYSPSAMLPRTRCLVTAKQSGVSRDTLLALRIALSFREVGSSSLDKVRCADCVCTPALLAHDSRTLGFRTRL